MRNITIYSRTLLITVVCMLINVYVYVFMCMYVYL